MYAPPAATQHPRQPNARSATPSKRPKGTRIIQTRTIPTKRWLVDSGASERGGTVTAAGLSAKRKEKERAREEGREWRPERVDVGSTSATRVFPLALASACGSRLTNRSSPPLAAPRSPRASSPCPPFSSRRPRISRSVPWSGTPPLASRAFASAAGGAGEGARGEPPPRAEASGSESLELLRPAVAGRARRFSEPSKVQSFLSQPHTHTILSQAYADMGDGSARLRIRQSRGMRRAGWRWEGASTSRTCDAR